MSKLIPVNSNSHGLGYASPSQITFADEFLFAKDDARISVILNGTHPATVFARYLKQMCTTPRYSIGACDGSVMLWYTKDFQTLTSKVIGWDLARDQYDDNHIERCEAIPDFWHKNPDGSAIKRPYRAVVRPDGSVFSPAIRREFKDIADWQKCMKARVKKEISLLEDHK